MGPILYLLFFVGFMIHAPILTNAVNQEKYIFIHANKLYNVSIIYFVVEFSHRMVKRSPSPSQILRN